VIPRAYECTLSYISRVLIITNNIINILLSLSILHIIIDVRCAGRSDRIIIFHIEFDLALMMLYLLGVFVNRD